ncbi:MAG: hypothetical protein DI570_23810 [Phenylobacterium zucineum]|nr:MAG: hypothetical protein DI570_23810 [Phenylobacterium zucineum]
MNLRGLFGSSARQVIGTPQSYVAKTDPHMDDPITRELGSGTVMRMAPQITANPQGDRDVRAQKAAILGATLSDIGASFRGNQGGSLERVQAGFRARAAQEKAQAETDKLKALASSLYGDDEEAQLLFMTAPEAFASAELKRRAPQIVEGDDGIYEVQGGQARLVQKYEPKAPNAPSGYRWKGENLEAIPGGPGDPKTWETKRRVVVDNPVRRAGGGRPGAGTTTAPSRRQPWAE